MQLLDGAPVYSATDLVGFLACAHRFELERAAMAGLVSKPVRSDPTIELVQERGYEHENRYLDDLRTSGRRIVEIPRDGSAANSRAGLDEAAELTRQAMRDGADVVYQATFFDGTWRGHADFLLRIDHAPGEPDSALGAWHYEVADTKLARHVKAGAVLQICSYVDQLTRVQRRQPERLHVALGGSGRETVILRVDDYMAYYRRVKADFIAAADDRRVGPPAYPPANTYPDPVEHCDVCRWWAVCRDRRRADDDLSLVAGISSRQRRGLKERPADAPPGPVRTRRGLAGLQLPLRPKLDSGDDVALARVREQARIQVEGEDRGETLWELLEPEWTQDAETGARTLVPDRGFLVLPEPSRNDLFLDLEGDPFALDDGVDYLFGVLDPASVEDDPRWTGVEAGAAAEAQAGAAAPKFHAFWSRDTDGLVTFPAEKAAFERLVDFLIARLDADPALHVYHYAAYEKTALARLAQRHATREDQVDRLLKGRVLVDLYRVVRQGIRASVESYSIKRLEPLYGLHREVNLKDAGSSIVEFEAWLGRGATADGLVGDEILREIEGYNRDDVLSTWRLRDWLERRRLDLGARLGVAIPRPSLADAAMEPPEPTERQAAVAAVVAALTRDLAEMDPASAELTALTDEQRAAWLLAQLLNWHRRENKAFWWRYYELCGMTDEDLLEAREPIGGVEFVEDLGSASKAGAHLQRFRFPPQDHAAKVGRRVDDPRVQSAVGTVREIDEVGGTVTLYRTATELARGIPTSLVPFDFVPTTVIEDSLLRVGRRAAELGAGQGIGHGIEHGIGDPGPMDRAGRELLLRRPPRIAGRVPGSPLRADHERALEAATRLVLDLDGTTLAIQGPPGTGKTYTGARMILALVAAGKTVGVTGNSHKVIGNVLDEVHRAAGEARLPEATILIGQKPGMGEPPTCPNAQDLAKWDGGKIAAALAGGSLHVVGGTAWLWSAAAMAGSVDVLLVDEAGQMSLANTIAVSPAARSLVLLGDPQQLDQPLKGSHPPGAERSALAHLLAGDPGQPPHATMPPERGLFIEKTWRLHPDVCAFTSEVFYESKLTPEAGRERQSVRGVPPESRPGVPPLRGAGIRWLPVEHAANAVDSPEEAAEITRLLGELFDPATDARWTNVDGVEAPLLLDDVVVVAPYNAHVDRIAAALRAAGLGGVRVGTVDKFQGQQAPLSIYAMGSSSPEDAPRGMEFLYSLNRLNVATSRARCIAAVVASPALVRVACQTPRQMRLANALCRLVEMSSPPA
jgi:predicted RecB family nuclease